jgi:succinate-acetate transporter protein
MSIHRPVTLIFYTPSVVSLRKSVAFVALFAVLSLTFVLLATAELATKHSVKLHSTKAAGALGLIAALIAFYIGLAELLASEEMSIVKLPLGAFNKE